MGWIIPSPVWIVVAGIPFSTTCLEVTWPHHNSRIDYVERFGSIGDGKFRKCLAGIFQHIWEQSAEMKTWWHLPEFAVDFVFIALQHYITKFHPLARFTGEFGGFLQLLCWLSPVPVEKGHKETLGFWSNATCNSWLTRKSLYTLQN